MDEIKICHGSKDLEELRDLIKVSFPDIKEETLQKISRGKRFEGWTVLYLAKKVVGCVAIFYRKNKYNFGVFCIHPDYRGKGLGRRLYKEISLKYKRLVWNVTDKDVLPFYIKLGASIIKTCFGEEGSEEKKSTKDVYWLTNIHDRVPHSAPVNRGTFKKYNYSSTSSQFRRKTYVPGLRKPGPTRFSTSSSTISNSMMSSTGSSPSFSLSAV